MIVKISRVHTEKERGFRLCDEHDPIVVVLNPAARCHQLNWQGLLAMTDSTLCNQSIYYFFISAFLGTGLR